MFLRQLIKQQSKFAQSYTSLLKTTPIMRFSYSIDPSSIYKRIGGEEAMKIAVVKFYDKMLADKRVDFFFKNTDMQKQIERQQQFLTLAFGGPDKYEGGDMVSVHTGMNITDEQYDIVVDHLSSTLKELGVQESVVGEVQEITEAVRSQIVGL